jgi:superoxide dismutase
VEIEGNCENVRIPIRDDSQFSDFSRENADLEDSWLTRPGSGWYWFLHHPQN